MHKIRRLKERYDLLSIEAKAIMWYTLCYMLQKGINMIVVPIYTRLLTPEEYGIFSVFNSWLQVFEIVATFHLFGGSYTVGLVKFENEKKQYTSSLAILSTSLTTMFLIFYIIFQTPINEITKMNTSMTLCLFILLYTTPLLGFWNAWQRVENNYIQMIIITLATTLFIPLLAIVNILLIKDNAMSVIYAQVVVNVIIILLLLFLYRSIFFQKPKKVFCLYGLRTSIPLLPHHLSTIVLNQSDRIMIQWLEGDVQAGIYSVAYSIAMVMILFNSSFNTSLQQWLFKCLKKNETKEIVQLSILSTVFIEALNLIVIFLAPEAMRFFAPKEYYSAVWVIPPVAASVVLIHIYQQFVNVEFYYEEGKMIAIGSIGAAALNIVLNGLLIPKYGYLVAGYTTLTSYAALTILHYLFMKLVCKKNNQGNRIYNGKAFLVIFIGFIVLASFALFTYEYTIVRYSIMLSVSIILLVKRKKMAMIWKNYNKLCRKKEGDI